MTNIHIEEFLVRGRPIEGEHPDVGRELTYHVVLAETGRDQFGNPFCHTSPPMTPEQAAKLGFPLPKIIAAINADLMNAHADLKVKHAALEQKIEDGVNVQIAELERLRAENKQLSSANAVLVEQLYSLSVPKPGFWKKFSDFFI